MDRFTAKVVDVNDPEKERRIKIRIYGIHDDVTRVPDDMLPWARCVFPVNSPVHQGVSGATTGIVPNATVVGYFADEHKQIPLVTGTLGGVSKSENGEQGVADFPVQDHGEDKNPVLNDSILKVGTSELKFLTSKTIGPIKYLGQDIDSMLQNIGEGNIKGALSQVKSTLSSFKDLKAQVTNAPLEQINSLIQGYASDLGAFASGEIDDIITGPLGNVINPVSTTETAASTTENGGIFGSTNHITGAIGTITSKLGINTPADAINRMNGHRFVMKNIMGSVNGALDNLRIKFGK